MGQSAPSAHVAASFLQEAGGCLSAEALDLRFADLCLAYGFKGAAYIRFDAVGAVSESRIIYGDVSAEWIVRYQERGYSRIDPRVPLVRRSRQGFTSGSAERLTRDRAAQAFFAEAREMFAADSFIVPLRGPFGQAGLLSLLSSERLSEGDAAERLEVEAVCRVYDSVSATFNGAADPEGPASVKRLGPREVECVYWMSMGKRDQDIAIRLGLSPLTVRAHIDGAKTKLGAATRPQLVRRALSLGLLPEFDLPAR
jgi:DNA-binding CsgD family transcriptional regulator